MLKERSYNGGINDHCIVAGFLYKKKSTYKTLFDNPFNMAFHFTLAFSVQL